MRRALGVGVLGSIALVMSVAQPASAAKTFVTIIESASYVNYSPTAPIEGVQGSIAMAKANNIPDKCTEIRKVEIYNGAGDLVGATFTNETGEGDFIIIVAGESLSTGSYVKVPARSVGDKTCKGAEHPVVLAP